MTDLNLNTMGCQTSATKWWSYSIAIKI